MNELVTFNSELKEATTTSLKIAEVFDKRHDRVLRAVNKILGDLREAEDFNHPKNEVVKFLIDSYVDEKGENRKQYILNKEAFYLLVMGFTGKKALQFKIEFINAFNAMERALKEKLPAPIDGKAIGGIVKRCAAVAVREELNNILSSASSIEAIGWNDLICKTLALRADALVQQKYNSLLLENEKQKQTIDRMKSCLFGC